MTTFNWPSHVTVDTTTFEDARSLLGPLAMTLHEGSGGGTWLQVSRADGCYAPDLSCTSTVEYDDQFYRWSRPIGQS
ncbi:MAG: hypothetical protein ACKPKO_26315, partial [Candidatus Fonsibacter sp.]